jgi:hypothetical protein
LSLTNINGVLQGSIDIGWSHITGPVTGGVDANGRMVIGGMPRIFGDEDAVQLRDWSFTLSGGPLTGSGISDSGFINIYGPVLMRTTYTEITLR